VLSIVVKSMKLFARSFLPPNTHSYWFVASFAGVVLLLLILGRTLWNDKKCDRLFWFLCIAWLVSYTPYIALGVSTIGYESERYLYYPSFFLCAVFVYAIWLLWSKRKMLFNTVVSAMLLYHIFFFIEASLVFKQISIYSKKGVQALQALPAGKRVAIQNLPVYSHGLPLFNYGFKSAVNWLAPQLDTNQVQVLSKKKFLQENIQPHTIQATLADTVIFSEN
jgi:hypothetical protein